MGLEGGCLHPTVVLRRMNNTHPLFTQHGSNEGAGVTRTLYIEVFFKVLSFC